MRNETEGYRPDIDGLRAIAVVSVLLFHSFPNLASGGFVGVDVFFVISGFLITSVLVKEVNEGRFSILRFYIRRARRIFPALVLVMAATLLMGWLILLPNEWIQLGRHVTAGALFLSNIQLWREAGYFDTASDLKPLLHLWSLAVEEQYYLIWPLVIFLGVRFGNRTLALASIGLCAASWLASVLLTPGHASMAFFLPLTRFWELLVGGGLAILQSNRGKVPSAPSIVVAEAMGVVGIVLTGISIYWLDRDSVFPGHLATLPVLGAALIIAAGPRATINCHLLSNRFMVWVGLISYPLYLWHWPLLAFPRIWFDEVVTVPLRASMLALATALAWLTYRWLETPIRAPQRSPRAPADALALWGLLFCLAAVGIASWASWLSPRSAGTQIVNLISQAERDWGYSGDKTWTGSRPGRVLLVGDSHMQQYAPRIDWLMANHAAQARSATMITLGGCAPVLGVTRKSIECTKFTQEAFAEMSAADVSTIVIAASWSGFAARPDYYRVGDSTRTPLHPLTDTTQWILDDWQERIASLTGAGKRVIVLLSNPRGPLVNPKHLIQRSLWSWEASPPPPASRAQLKLFVDDADRRIAAAARAAGAEIVDPFDGICRDTICPATTEDGNPIFMDDSHLRASYAAMNVLYLDPFLLQD